MQTDRLSRLASVGDVLFVLDYFYPHLGGGETLFWELARSLAKGGTRVGVVTLRHDRELACREVVAGVEIHRVATPSWASRLWFILLAIPVVWRQAKRADLIHATLYSATFPAWIVAFLRRKPIVLTVYEVFGSQWQRLQGVGFWAGWAFRCYEWLILHLPVTHCIAISHFTKKRLTHFAGADSNRISVVHAAVDYDFWNPQRHQARRLREEHSWKRDTFVYLFFGRPGVSKGVEDLIEAAVQVRAKLPNSRLVLLLSREPRQGRIRIERLIDTKGLADHVLLLDPVPREELPGYLLAADCVVVPSISEGFGYSAVESRSLGCRVLTTTGHAVEEVLSGYVELVAPGDPVAIAERLVEISGRREPPPPAPQHYTLAAHLDAVGAVYSLAVAAVDTANK